MLLSKRYDNGNVDRLIDFGITFRIDWHLRN